MSSRWQKNTDEQNASPFSRTSSCVLVGLGLLLPANRGNCPVRPNVKGDIQEQFHMACADTKRAILEQIWIKLQIWFSPSCDRTQISIPSCFICKNFFNFRSCESQSQTFLNFCAVLSLKKVPQEKLFSDCWLKHYSSRLSSAFFDLSSTLAPRVFKSAIWFWPSQTLCPVRFCPDSESQQGAVNCSPGPFHCWSSNQLMSRVQIKSNADSLLRSPQPQLPFLANSEFAQLCVVHDCSQSRTLQFSSRFLSGALRNLQYRKFWVFFWAPLLQTSMFYSSTGLCRIHVKRPWHNFSKFNQPRYLPPGGFGRSFWTFHGMHDHHWALASCRAATLIGKFFSWCRNQVQVVMTTKGQVFIVPAVSLAMSAGAMRGQKAQPLDKQKLFILIIQIKGFLTVWVFHVTSSDVFVWYKSPANNLLYHIAPELAKIPNSWSHTFSGWVWKF